MAKLRVLVIGCGNMGASHARAYYKNDAFEIVGLVDRSGSRREPLSAELGDAPQFDDYAAALSETQPDVVCIATYPDTHADFATTALEAGAHVFVEKPIAVTVPEAQRVVDLARERNRKLVVGYILRVHPAWQKFIELSQTLGKPLVMRMNLNQQSAAEHWATHKQLMNAMPPIVDCGVHYVDVMCQMTRSTPVRVYAIGARLSNELKPGMMNYGCLQVTFDDGSVGWYEAGWGPMMSETAFFVKDVVGPAGCVSIVADDSESDDIDAHTKTNRLRLHHAELNADGQFAQPDELISTADEPDHQGLCDLEQQFLLDTITHDHVLTDHWHDAINSLRIVCAAEESTRTGQVISLT